MPTLSWRRKLAFGSGDTALSLLGTTIDVYFLYFLLTVAKVPPAYAAAAIFVAKTWDWVNDPLMGVLSDRTRSRWGRRRPWLLFGAPPFGALVRADVVDPADRGPAVAGRVLRRSRTSSSTRASPWSASRSRRCCPTSRPPTTSAPRCRPGGWASASPRACSGTRPATSRPSPSRAAAPWGGSAWRRSSPSCPPARSGWSWRRRRAGSIPTTATRPAAGATRRAGSRATSARGCRRRWLLAVGVVAGLALWIGLLYVLPRSLPGPAGTDDLDRLRPVRGLPRTHRGRGRAVLPPQPPVPLRRGDLPLHLDDRRGHPVRAAVLPHVLAALGGRRWSCPWGRCSSPPSCCCPSGTGSPSGPASGSPTSSAWRRSWPSSPCCRRCRPT